MLRAIDRVLESMSLFIDLLLIGIGFYLVVDFYQVREVIRPEGIPLNYVRIFLVNVLFWTLGTKVTEVYESRSFMSLAEELLKIAKTLILLFLSTIFFLYLFDEKLISNHFQFYFMVTSIGLIFGTHILIRLLLENRRRLGHTTKYSLILGSGLAAKKFIEKVKKSPRLGYKVIGYLALQKNELEVPYLGDYSHLESVMNLNIVDMTVVTAPLTEVGIEDSLMLLGKMGKCVTIMVDDRIAKVARHNLIDFDGLSMVALDSNPRKPWQEIAKQVIDFGITTVGLVLISPLMVVIALAIRITSKGPAVFSQERVGLNGRIFKMYKFRSMVVNAEELKAKLSHLNEMSGPVFKIRDDPRVTKVGKFLRKTSLDELPQLWNVLKQDMSLVGPRPPLPSEVNMYDSKHRKRLSVRPGITCIWQISGRNDVDFEQWMEMDAEYVDRWSLWLDLEILAKTVPVVLMKKGAS